MNKIISPIIVNIILIYNCVADILNIENEITGFSIVESLKKKIIIPIIIHNEPPIEYISDKINS